ncbi:hypothetical protein M8C21_004567 [Ambrosia artemisiifolia]|uniref:Uncharacterized protein n=1 Tax=Ambrosia artemisiifolia TaxID=4212 RepID=A0AAD5G1B1_AMBAR|nr:hypothetical protein M8C21_004567 [Ambrosia artemisiifolia]
MKFMQVFPLEQRYLENTMKQVQLMGRRIRWMMENEKATCNVDDQFNGLPGLGEFIPLNESDFLEAKNMGSSDGDQSSCSFEEFQMFESSLYNFTSLVGEFFLPPERLKFGLVSERSLLSSLGVADTRSWFIMLYSIGCPSCTKFFKGGSDLKKILELNSSPVMEASLYAFSLIILYHLACLKSYECYKY